MSVLSSLRVLDFSTLLPGPFASMLLADMGADVLRVEAPTRPDYLRMGPPFEDGVSAGHAFISRSKQSIALDLKQEAAVEIVKRLVQSYDIVLEQFRPGVMDRLGIGYEALAAENPKLIYCALTGYGQTGPMRDRAGHDINYLSLAGVLSHSGTQDGGPAALGVQIADIGAGSLGAVSGILAAAVHRHVTGEGQMVDISMFDGSVIWNAYATSQMLIGSEVPDYEMMRLNGGSHYGCYRTKDGRYMSVGSLEPQFWIGLCDTLGLPELKDKMDAPGPLMKPVRDAIAKAFAEKTRDEWVEIFNQVDVCVEPVLTLEETFEHPHTVARDMLVDVPKPDGSTQRQVGTPFKFSKSPPVYKHIGGGMGENTDDVLAELGYSAAEIESMREKGIFGPT